MKPRSITPEEMRLHAGLEVKARLDRGAAAVRLSFTFLRHVLGDWQGLEECQAKLDAFARDFGLHGRWDWEASEHVTFTLLMGPSPAQKN